jgi:hypothetical protein
VTALERLLAVLEHENHGRLGGRDRLSTVFAPDGSMAVVNPDLAVSVLRGLWEAK